MNTDCNCKEKGTFFCKNNGGIGPFRQALEDFVRQSDSEWTEDYKWSSEYLPYYIHFIREYVATLDRKSQIAYYHYISRLPKEHTSVLLQMNEKQIERLLNLIYSNATKFFKEHDVFSEESEYYECFLNKLLDEKQDDDDIAEQLNEDIAAVKISRIFALQSKIKFATT